MMEIETNIYSQLLDGLCSNQKLERDKTLMNLKSQMENFRENDLVNLVNLLLQVLHDKERSWECYHGTLQALPLILSERNSICTDEFVSSFREISIQLLTHTEVRARQAAGEALGCLCSIDKGSTYNICKAKVLDLIRMNLERQPSMDESSIQEFGETRKLMDKLALTSGFDRKSSTDAAQIFHDTAGWRNLETSMKCLECMILGCGANFLPFINQDLLELIFSSLVHTNRFVRETGFNVCAALVSCGQADFLLEEHPMVVYGDQLSKHIGDGLADNWSQVRLAASIATRKFLLSLPHLARNTYYTILLPRICLNRYYMAEGVRLYSQETWRLIAGNEGKVLVEKYIGDVVNYYLHSSTADNHAVREAACACIAELAQKLPSQSLKPHVNGLLMGLTNCFGDDSWPVRDAACLACGNFISCFPDESAPQMDTLYPLFFYNLQDSISSVRAGAASSLSRIAATYKTPALQRMILWIQEAFEGISSQPSESIRYGGMEAENATYGVVKRNRDNDAELHSDKQMYSCGSLAPKMGRGGGCMDSRFRREAEPWERAEGGVQLLGELSGVREAIPQLGALLPMLGEALRFRHYTAHLCLYESVCKILPRLCKSLGKRDFKAHFSLFIDPIFNALEGENALSAAAACQCITELAQMLGPNILRGRIEAHNPVYLQSFGTTIKSIPY